MVNLLWIEAEDEAHATAAVIDAVRTFKAEGTVGRVATLFDTEPDRKLYDEFMAYTDSAKRKDC
jgi:hypothetical protein